MARQPDPQDLERLSLRLGRDQIAAIEALARAARTSRATIARQLIQEALDARALRQQAAAPYYPLGADGPAMEG